ncbi:hypothetical protein ACHAXS_009020 [Conticribra weissflogii]
MSAGVYHWFALMMSLATGDMIDISAMETKIDHESKQSPVSDNINEENKNEIRRQMRMEKIHTILAQISHLTLQFGKVTNQPDELNTKLSSFQSAIHKECLPGRDDSNGEINPTTHKSRECLRFVPLAKNNRQNESQKQRPRIGIMAPPGIISSSLSLWIADSLRNSQTIGGTATNNIELEIIPTSHVPVYGYGKSHGFTKLIRLVTLPIQLSMLDAYLWAKYESSSTVPSSTLSSSLSTDPPSEKVLALALRLIMRWHCRLSHVSAHTSMLTVALDEILNDPEGLLNEILSFVWRYDWEWEGKGNDKRKDSNNLKDTTKGIISSEYNEDSSFELLLKRTSAILGNIGSNKSSSSMISNVGFQTALENAFKEEMVLSKDLTKWPCPSFWEGIDDLDDGDGESNQDVTVLRRLATQMVPNCQDGDPFVRCTVNRDRCEVAGNANCK